MKKIYFLAILLLATSFTFAQRPEGGQRGQRSERTERAGNRKQFSAEQMAQRNTDWMKKNLNLTDAQVVSVHSINLDHAKAQAALFQSRRENREQNRAAMKELRTQKQAALSSVLTTDQMGSYRQQMSKMSERGNREGFNKKQNNSDKQFKQHKQKAS